MKNKLLIYFLLLLFILVFIGCGSSPSSPPPPEIFNGYIAGAISYDGISYVPCYWKAGVIHKLPGAGCQINAICTSGTDVHCAGFYVSGSTPIACYWKNDTKIDLPEKHDTPNSIFVSNVGDVFISTVNGVYWKNGNLETPPAFTNWNSIYVTEPDLYIAGKNDSGLFYWKNETPTSLIIPSYTTSLSYSIGQIKVIGTDVYVPGGYEVDNSGWIPCYWKNGDRFNLTALGATARVRDIYVFGTDIYLVGENGPNNKCYWKNNTRTDIGSGVINFDMIGSDIYQLGATSQTNPLPCYWKNGTQFNLPLGNAKNGIASAIWLQ